MAKVQHPLVWPEGHRRTRNPQPSRFEVTYRDALKGLVAEVERLDGNDIVITHNPGIRAQFYVGSGYSFPEENKVDPKDAGVAVWFMRKGKQVVFACDRWGVVKDNIRALQKTVEALRGLERWGASRILEQAFRGFEALPSPHHTPTCWEILGLQPGASRNSINAAYRAKAAFRHPDAGGSHAAMAELNAARDEALTLTL